MSLEATVPMAKAISSASEVLAAITGKTKIYEIEGITLELRPLSALETEVLVSEYGEQPVRMALEVVKIGIANPHFDEAQLAQLESVSVGIIQAISSEIMAFSGMGVQKDAPPLAGDGLPNP